MTRPLCPASRRWPAAALRSLWRILLAGSGLVLALGWPALAWDGARVADAARRHGDNAVAAVRQLDRLVQSAQGLAQDRQKLALVNDYFNQALQFRDDLDVWGQVDYWASPLESLQRGQGDCEDFAIAKYFTLVAMGVPHRQLRMVYVRAQLAGPGAPGVPHMVLAFYPRPDADPWVLDSLIPEVRLASQRPDLQPVFSFNADGLWEGAGPVSLRGHPTERLSRWREVLLKGRLEGFL